MSFTSPDVDVVRIFCVLRYILDYPSPPCFFHPFPRGFPIFFVESVGVLPVKSDMDLSDFRNVVGFFFVHTPKSSLGFSPTPLFLCIPFNSRFISYTKNKKEMKLHPQTSTDTPHPLDWSLSSPLVYFTSLVDNCLVTEVHQVRVDNCL